MSKCKGPTCPKGGIKIHESDNNYKQSPFSQEEFYTMLKQQNRHTGVRIENYDNDHKSDPFEGANPFSNPDGREKEFTNVTYNKSAMEALDLNIHSYSREDIFKLFGIHSPTLTEDMMREAKKIVLKTHPDKSRLDQKYFLFFSSAYKKLYGIYEFQNKTAKKMDHEIIYDQMNPKDPEHSLIIDKLFETNKDLKKPGNFNKWFNEEFEKNRLENPIEQGYGDWFKSNADLTDMSHVTKANMNEEIEKKKKQVRAITNYTGVHELNAGFSGSALMDRSSTYSSSLFSADGMGYTDLKQAYTETVIPVTEEDYHSMPKFKNVEEYKRHQATVSTTPLAKDEAMKVLYRENKEKDEESAALAYHYAKQAEKAKQNQDNFWSSLKQLTHWN